MKTLTIDFLLIVNHSISFFLIGPSYVKQTAAKSQKDIWMLASSDGSFRPTAS